MRHFSALNPETAIPEATAIHSAGPPWAGHAQRAEEHGVDDAEDSGIGADAERQGDDSHKGEAGTLHEGAEAEPDVLPQSAHDSPFFFRPEWNPKRSGRQDRKSVRGNQCTHLASSWYVFL